MPIYGSQREFRGIMAGLFKISPNNVSSFYGDIVKLRLNKGGVAYVVDSKGHVIYHTNSARIGEDFSDQEAVQSVQQGKSTALRATNRAGQEIVAAYAPIPGTPWGLIIEESWDALNRSSQGYRQFLVLLLILGFVLPSLFVAFGVRRITRPIEELIDAAQKVAAGNFEQQIQVTTDDEIAELARQFNHMSAQLRASYAEMEGRVSSRTKELSTLYELAQATSQSLDLNTVLNTALERILDVLDFDLGVLYLKHPRTGKLEPVHEIGVPESYRYVASRGTLSARAAEIGTPLIINNLVLLEDPPTDLIAAGFQSSASIPLISKHQVQGVLSLASYQIRTFQAQDIALLTSVGRQIGVAIENARLYETEQRRSEQFRVIGEMGRSITSILNVDDLLHQMTHLIQSTFDYYHVGIGLIIDDEVVYQVGAGPMLAEINHTFSPSRLKIGKEGLSGWVAATGEPLMVADIHVDPRYVRLAGSNTQSELVLPIKTKGQVIGILDVQQNFPSAFDEVEMTVLQSLANQAGVAIENARLYEQAQQLAVLEERQRLARDLHDSVTQSLYGATLYAEAAARLLDSGNTKVAAEHMRTLRDTAHEALGEMRLLIFELRPSVLEAEGLAAALHARLEAVEGRTGLQTQLQVDTIQKLPPDVEEGLYWISQEVLNNTLKHAKASQVSLHVEPMTDHPGVCLRIHDNGAGFDTATAHRSGGWGLRGIAERVVLMDGTWQVESSPGNGTTITVHVPI